jgi:hypothetical protein
VTRPRTPTPAPRAARNAIIARLAAIIAEVDPDSDLFTEDLAAAIVDRLVAGGRP